MVCLGLKPGAAGWKVQTNPLSYGGLTKVAKISGSVFVPLENTSLENLMWLIFISSSSHTGDEITIPTLSAVIGNTR